MSRKKDPIVGVLNFFTTASLEVATMALALVKSTVRGRTPVPEKKVRRRLATRPMSETMKSPTAAEPPAPPPPTIGTPGHRMPRRRMHAAPSQAEREGTLPGMGPSVIGE